MQSLSHFKNLVKARYALVRQYEQVDCGPAALLTVLRFWRGNTTLVHVRSLSQTDSSGSTMLGLVQAARALGFEAKGATGEYEDLIKEDMPCIAHVIMDDRLQHFIVVFKINAKGVIVGDPGKGVYKLSRNEFLAIWREKAVILLAPKQLYHGKSSTWLSWILTYFRTEESWLYQSIFLGLIYTALGLLVAVFIQSLIDKLIPGRDYFKIIITGVFLLALQLLRALAGYLKQMFLVELNKRVNTNVNRDFLSHLFQLPLSFFDTHKIGDITARINDSIKIQQVILTVIGVTVIDGLIVLGSFLFLFMLARPIAWIAMATLPLYAVVLFLTARKIKQKHYETMKAYARVESFYFDSLGGISEILGFNASLFFAKSNTLLYENFQNQVARLGLTQAKVSLQAELSAGVLIMGTLTFGAISVMNASLLLGQMMAAYAILANMVPAVNRLVEANISLQGASMAARRLMDLLLVPKESNVGHLPFKMAKSLEIIDGQFTWPKGKCLFNNLNLSIQQGRITGLWGVSGAGKSTLVKILQRKYLLSSGKILIDSLPINEFDLQSCRKNIAVVPQSVKVFNGTIAENILLGRHISNIEDMAKRLDSYGLTAFISRFGHGMFTPIGEEGRQLSGGELQLLGLLRALYDEPEILILDEGISAIDAEIESFVFEILRRYAKRNAVLVISHNLRTIFRTDFTFLLSDGTVIQSGTPTELLHKSGHFRKLWEIQQNHEFELEGSSHAL